ncbi:ArsR/SmtB family transcription factor [Haloarcula litorea]|uniref:ArsR/SmtB family transcription factor n=1 Tax=Haloarcula litorea TaxID=3032579 RepID=UPI0023E7C477|nr:winged helix-turn-helix domain-containing protein [Halomicroarcula sp. GDY20]
MSLLPSRGPDASASQDGDLQIVGVDEDVSAALDALSSETAREILNAVYDDPGTPSELADRLDMSIQKVSYHLEKLEDEELIAVAGTQYSEKGQEMKVYEPPEEPLVLFVGTQDRKRSLKGLVQRLIPVVGLLTAASLVVQLLLGNISLPVPMGQTGAGGADGGGAGGDAVESQATTETETPTEAPTDTATATSADGGDGGGMNIAENTDSPTATDAPAETVTEEPATAIQTEAPTTETPVPETDTSLEYAAEATEVARTAAGSGGLEVAPGLAFLLGGLFVVAVFVGLWAYREY